MSWHLLNSRGVSRPVASLQPNEWGLFDVLGNVQEWTVGVPGPNHMDATPRGILVDDVLNHRIGDDVGRIVRGGDFSLMPLLMRSAAKLGSPLNPPTPNIGFRIVRTLPRQSQPWRVLDDWVCGLHGETFQALVPLLRRTFSTFPAPERRKIGERVKHEPIRRVELDRGPVAFDLVRADAVLPLVERLLGLNGYKEDSRS